MPSTLTTVLIAGTTAAFGWLWGRHKGEAALASADLAVAVATPEALYSTEEVVCEVEFDEEANGLYTRVERGIIPKFDVAELTIPYRFNVTSQGSLDVPTITSDHRVQFVPESITPTRVAGSLRLTGPFQRGVKLPGYVVRQSFHRGFYTSRKEMAEAYSGSSFPKEYFGMANQIPVNVLRLTVLFPDGSQFAEEPFPCAFIGETESLHPVETTRLKASFRRDGRSAELRVDRPRSGVRYAVAWVPSDKRAVV